MSVEYVFLFTWLAWSLFVLWFAYNGCKRAFR